jgi:hypothetical protein
MNILAAMLNIFVDPQAAVDRFHGRKFAWIWPVLITGAVTAVVGLITVPIVRQVMSLNPPEGLSGEQLERTLSMIQTVSKVTAFLSPVMVAIMLLMSAGILLGACSVLDIKAKFFDLYTLLAYCSLVSLLNGIAMGLVVYFRRNDIQTMAELQPAFGLNLLLPDDANRLLEGVLGFFSIFTIWYIVILALAFAYMTKVPRGKAFAATSPVWFVGMVFYIVGVMFRK